MKNSIFILSILLCCNLFCGCSESDESDSRQFPPKLISIIPKAGSTGGTAIISGVHFSETAIDNEVFINGVQAEIIDATQNRLVIALPNNPEGTYSIKVSVKGEVVEGLKFTYATPQAPPELAVLQVMPSSAYAGDLVTLIGQCFSTVVSENQVTINGVTAEVKEATSSQLKIIIPDTEEGSYPIRVRIGTKEAESPLFTYLHTVTLTTSSLTPARGKAGEEVVISGEGFGTTVEENMVSINGKQATVKVVTATTLTIIAPENPSGTYPVKVTVADKTVENLSFTYEDLSYTVATVAGNSATTSTDGKGTAASFKFPQGLALAPNGDIWIAERGNNVIRKMDQEYNVSTVAKSGTVTFDIRQCRPLPDSAFRYELEQNKDFIDLSCRIAGVLFDYMHAHTTIPGADLAVVDFTRDGQPWLGTSNPSSPMIIQSFILLFCCKTPSDVRIATAIGRSNDAPLFLIVAGERLITTRFAGNSRPEFRTADRTRSAASFTSDDRYPTM